MPEEIEGDTQEQDDDEEEMDEMEEDEDEEEDDLDVPGPQNEIEGADIPGSPMPTVGAMVASPQSGQKPGTPSILQKLWEVDISDITREDIPCSQPDPETPDKQDDDDGDHEMTHPIDKHAIVMVSDDDVTPKKAVISDVPSKEAITLYEEKLKQLKAQLSTTKKKKCAERLSCNWFVTIEFLLIVLVYQVTRLALLMLPCSFTTTKAY